MSLAVVQHKSQINGSAIPGTFTLTSTPVTGNLVIAVLGVNIVKGGLTLNTTDWHVLKIARSEKDDTTFGVVLARYAQSGDTSTLPAFATAGTTYSAYMVWEVSGISGTLTDDVLGIFGDTGHDSLTAFPLSDMNSPVSGALALVAAYRYNGATNPSLSAGWTQDEAQHNNTNYGSIYGGHQGFSDGDAIGGTATVPSTGTPGGWFMLLLGDGTAPTRPFVRQGTKRTDSVSGHPGSLNLGMNPLDGSLVVACIAWARGDDASPTINTTDWPNLLTHADKGSNQHMIVLARYASGDNGQAMAALTTAGSAFYFAQMIEITGVTGTIGTDVVFADSGRQNSGSTITTTSRTTSDTDQLAIVFAANYDASDELAFSGSFGTLMRAVEFSDYGAIRIGQKPFPTSGSTVQTTITENNTGDAAAWAQIIIANGAGGGGGGPPPGGGQNRTVVFVIF